MASGILQPVPGRDSRRSSSGFVPLHRLPLPTGAPRALRAAALAAAVRDLLGAELAGHVLGVTLEGRRLVVTFAGAGWRDAVLRSAPDLQARAAVLLRMAPLELELRAGPEAPPSPARFEEPPPTALAERLARAARLIRERRRSR